MNIIKAPFHFKGGIHPKYHKDLSNAAPSVDLPMPKAVSIPMQQHLGAPAVPCVSAGDRVLRGQLIGTAAGFISANVHSSVSGTVKSLDTFPTPVGRPCLHVTIETDGADERALALTPYPDWGAVERAGLVKRVQDAGIVGMGGAGFPTNVKLSPKKPIDTLILNGAECEPYLTSDHRAMLEHAREIWEGCKILRYILGAQTVRIAIEENKMDAVEMIAKVASDAEGDAAIAVLETMYPQGSEKQQIYAVTGREVPSSGLPMDVGCVVENVGTAYAIWNAIVNGCPLDERIITVTGPAISRPQNYRTRTGTSFRALVEAADGVDNDVAKVISGGPMMGFALPSLDVYSTKTTSGLLALRDVDVAEYEAHACISCGRCNTACPMRLMPSEFGILMEANDVDGAERENVMDCFECGSCTYACPAHRPLVQHIRRAKGIISARSRAAAAKAAAEKPAAEKK